MRSWGESKMSAELVSTIVVLPIQDGNHSFSPQITPPAPVPPHHKKVYLHCTLHFQMLLQLFFLLHQILHQLLNPLLKKHSSELRGHYVAFY